ncbi:hypothetical protein [Shewanella sp.]|uniref:hypothetical protein n=1 Tax=Shewanella sp. TaxID=50422 RepID=UPI0025D15CD9|nr:hypothetical protein [Shewanella sp.]
MPTVAKKVLQRLAQSGLALTLKMKVKPQGFAFFFDLWDTQVGRYYRYWTQKNQYGPKPIAVVCDGSRSLTVGEDGRTQATYWLYTYLAGSISAWLANTVNPCGLYDIL